MLSDTLPKFITDIGQINEILLAIDPEIQLQRDDLTQLEKEIYIKLTENAILRWEADFGLPYDSTLTLQQRRDVVLNKIQIKRIFNAENRINLIKENVTKPQFYIIDDSDSYHFRIIVQDTDFSRVSKAMDIAIPAYLTYDIIVTEYFKRCGTFRTGTNPI